MTTVIEAHRTTTHRPVFLCDFSPPRSADTSFLADARNLSADFLCVAYSPGRAVRADSAFVAHTIKQNTGKGVIFNLSTRDMNKLALQMHLLGASMLGLENVVVLRGDDFSEQDSQRVKAVHDFTVTGLIKAIVDLNKGIDFRGRRLDKATSLCVGATFDLAKGIEREAKLAHKKVLAGAQFFITQPTFDPRQIETFDETYRQIAGEHMSAPVFWGLQVLAHDGVAFGQAPQHLLAQLEKGRSGPEIALELLGQFRSIGVRGIYLVPPIFKGGTRDYKAAQAVLSAAVK